MTQDEKPSRSPIIEALQALSDIPAVERNDADKADGKNEEVELRSLEIRDRQLDIAAKEQNIQARKKHSNFALCIIIIWLVVVLGIVILSGFCPAFYITENTLIALIGSTTANVLGFYVIILKYFFH